MEEKNSSLTINVLIKGVGFELSTEGRISDLYGELDNLTKFADAVSRKLGTRFETSSASDSTGVSKEANLDVANIPIITPSKNTVDNIKSLFDTAWGKTPRKNVEVFKALEVNAIPFDKHQMSKYLTRLVHKGHLRRIEKEGQYHYFKVPG